MRPREINLGALLSAADLLAWCFSPAGRRQLERWGLKRAQYVTEQSGQQLIRHLPRGHPLAGRILNRCFSGLDRVEVRLVA